MQLLRQWRQRRRRSQLDLALDTGISARHLSFVETGRSRPSRGLLLALAEQLDVPLRERNALMLAAGYAPTYAESDLDSAETPAGARRARAAAGRPRALPGGGARPVGRCRADQPRRRPAARGCRRPSCCSRRSTSTGSACTRTGWSRASATGPNGPPTSDTGWPGWPGSPATRGLRSCSPRYAPIPGVAEALDGYHEPTTSELLLTLQLAHPAGDLRLHSTVTSFGSPHDVTLSELTVESFFPADDATRQRLQALSG